MKLFLLLARQYRQKSTYKEREENGKKS